MPPPSKEVLQRRKEKEQRGIELRKRLMGVATAESSVQFDHRSKVATFVPVAGGSAGPAGSSGSQQKVDPTYDEEKHAHLHADLRPKAEAVRGKGAYTRIDSFSGVYQWLSPEDPAIVGNISGGSSGKNNAGAARSGVSLNLKTLGEIISPSFMELMSEKKMPRWRRDQLRKEASADASANGDASDRSQRSQSAHKSDLLTLSSVYSAMVICHFPGILLQDTSELEKDAGTSNERYQLATEKKKELKDLMIARRLLIDVDFYDKYFADDLQEIYGSEMFDCFRGRDSDDNDDGSPGNVIADDSVDFLKKFLDTYGDYVRFGEIFHETKALFRPPLVGKREYSGFHNANSNDDGPDNAPNEANKFIELSKQNKWLVQSSTWNLERLRIVDKVLRDRFRKNGELRQKLEATGERELVWENETDLWFGVVRDSGQNNYGQLLEDIRFSLKNKREFDDWLIRCIGLEDPSLNLRISYQTRLEETKNGEVQKTYDLDELRVKKEDRSTDLGSNTSGNSGKKTILYLGRQKDACDIPALHESLSRKHAVLVWTLSEGMCVLDFDSVRGVKVNGRRLRKAELCSLRNGDEIQLGESTRKYKVVVDHRGTMSALHMEQRQLNAELNAEKGLVRREMYQSADSFLSAAQKREQQAATCFVAGLDYKTSKLDLIRILTQNENIGGSVVEVRFPGDKGPDGKPPEKAVKGFGFVIFDTPKTALKACGETGNIEIYGRSITIRMSDGDGGKKGGKGKGKGKDGKGGKDGEGKGDGYGKDGKGKDGKGDGKGYGKDGKGDGKGYGKDGKKGKDGKGGKDFNNSGAIDPSRIAASGANSIPVTNYATGEIKRSILANEGQDRRDGVSPLRQGTRRDSGSYERGDSGGREKDKKRKKEEKKAAKKAKKQAKKEKKRLKKEKKKEKKRLKKEKEKEKKEKKKEKEAKKKRSRSDSRDVSKGRSASRGRSGSRRSSGGRGGGGSSAPSPKRRKTDVKEESKDSSSSDGSDSSSDSDSDSGSDDGGKEKRGRSVEVKDERRDEVDRRRNSGGRRRSNSANRRRSASANNRGRSNSGNRRGSEDNNYRSNRDSRGRENNNRGSSNRDSSGARDVKRRRSRSRRRNESLNDHRDTQKSRRDSRERR